MSNPKHFSASSDDSSDISSEDLDATVLSEATSLADVISSEDLASDTTSFTITDLSDSTELKQEKHPFNKKRAARIGGITIAVLAGIYCAGALVFSGRFYPKTTLQAQDVSLKAARDVSGRINSNLDTFKITISGDGISKTLFADDLDIKLDTNAFVTEALSEQNIWAWPVEIFKSHHLQAQYKASYNKDKLHAALTEDIAVINKDATQPQNATAQFDANQQKFIAAKEIYGTAIDEEALNAFVGSKIVALQSNIKLGEESLMLPAITSDNTDLKAQVDKANSFMIGNTKLTFNGTEARVLSNEDIAQWVLFSGTTDASLDTNAIYTWAKGDLSKQLDTAGTTRYYTRPDGTALSVTGGTYGWIIDGTALADKIVAQIEAKTTDDIEIPAKQTAQAWTEAGGQDWSNSYIDVSISEQYARYYVDGTLTWESYLVSGKTSNRHGTPTGVYAVNNYKGTDQMLIGFDEDHDGKPDYKSHVNYWIPFIDNVVAFHDAPWRGNFGGTIYQYNGSHGCVNLPADKAAELYNLVPVGTVVVVHE
ncbi:L,D-transpeptidase family protein [Atopobium fossor]|uniref:L,D-transpeptidase family protein n=1 Tax=Atopobium fossor TaxID=39487 RepID=UPI00041E6059|nr:L,D-transpeptidase family protein [Atopobium fossor]